MKKIIQTVSLVILIGWSIGVGAATINISNWGGVPNQNIAVGVPNQPIGGFSVSVTDAPATIFSLDFDVVPGAVVSHITDISVYDSSGTIVAGPVDAHEMAGRYPILFTDPIGVAVGNSTYAIKGKVGTGVENEQTITLKLSGITFGLEHQSLIQFPVTLSTMTVKKGALKVSVFEMKDTTIISGVRQYEGLGILLDTTSSSEGVRTAIIPLILTIANGAKATDISNVQLYDGATSVTTGSNSLNPTQDGELQITLNGNGLILPAGTVKALTLRFDLRISAVGTFQWSMPTNHSNSEATGILTANAITPVLVRDGNGPVLTVIQHGEIMAQNDYYRSRLYSAGTNTTIAEFVLLSSYEKMNGYLLKFQSKMTNAAVPLVYYLRSGTNTLGRAHLFPEENNGWGANFFLENSASLQIDPSMPVHIKLMAEESSQLNNRLRGEIVTELVSVEAVGTESGARIVYTPSKGSIEPFRVSLDQTRIEDFATQKLSTTETAIWFDFIIPEDGKKYILEESPDLKRWFPKENSLIFEGPDDGKNDGGRYGNLVKFPNSAFYRLRELAGPFPECPIGSYLIIDENGVLRCN